MGFWSFKKKIKKWLRQFIKKNDGTILTSGKFEDFLKYYKPIEKIYEHLLQSNGDITTMIALKDDRITERNRTLAYFKDNSILRYRDFVEDIGHKYVVQEHEIKKSMEKLPFD